MVKRKVIEPDERQLVSIPSATLQEPKQQRERVAIPSPDELPAEFKNVKPERLSEDLCATIKWPDEPRARACGFYSDRKQGIGQKDTDLFIFKYKGLTFGVWENFDLGRTLKDAEGNMKINRGDFVDMVFVETIDTDQPRPMRKFEVTVYRKQ